MPYINIIKFRQLKSIVEPWRLLGLVCTIFLIYLPMCIIPYGTADDYFHIWDIIQFGNNYLLGRSVQDGRLIQGVILSLFFSPRNINDLLFYRLLNLSLISILSIFVYIYISWLFQSQNFSLLTTLFIFSLPGYQLFLHYTILFGTIISAILSGLSVTLIYQFLQRERSKSFLLISFILYLLAMMLYQPAAMFYWFFVVIVMLKKVRTLENEEFFLYCKIFILLAGFVYILSFLILRIGSSVMELSQPRSLLISLQDIPSKLQWFFSKALPKGLNILAFENTNWTIDKVFILIIIVSGIFIWLKGSIGNRLIRGGSILVFTLLAYLPNLIVYENWESYRSLIAFSSLLFFIFSYFLYIGIQKLNIMNKPVTIIVIGILVFVKLSSTMYQSISYNALPLYLEQKYISFNLKRFDPSVYEKVLLIKPEWDDTPSPVFIGDEYGMLSTFTSWGPGPLVHDLLTDINPNFKTIDVEVVDVTNLPKNIEFSTFVIDMREMAKFKEDLKISGTYGLFRCDTKSQTPLFGKDRTFHFAESSLLCVIR